MAYEAENNKHLEELHGSDYQIVEGEPDISGWDVIDGEGRKIGEVEDVLFDPQTRSVRYIIVDLGENELEIDTDKKVLVPIGIAELRDEEETDTDDAEAEYDDEIVYLPGLTAAQLTALPAYEKGNLSPEQEIAIRQVFEAPKPDALIIYEKDVFYTHPHFENRIYPDREDL